MVLKVIAGVISLAYPFLVYWGMLNVDARFVLPVLLVLLGLRWVIGGQVNESHVNERKILLMTAVALLTVIAVWGLTAGLKFYPVLMNLGFLTVFAGSLFAPMTVVEKIARLKDPDLPPEGVIYTRKVTQVWCAFFLINGSLAAGTALYASDEVWLLYNGFIAYILIAALAAGEWLVRRKVKPEEHGRS